MEAIALWEGPDHPAPPASISHPTSPSHVRAAWGVRAQWGGRQKQGRTAKLPALVAAQVPRPGGRWGRLQGLVSLLLACPSSQYIQGPLAASECRDTLCLIAVFLSLPHTATASYSS